MIPTSYAPRAAPPARTRAVLKLTGAPCERLVFERVRVRFAKKPARFA
jgi:hypothetical protein